MPKRARAQMHIAALGLDAYVGIAVAGFELEPRAGTVVGALRLGPEAIIDRAAEGLESNCAAGADGKSKRRLPLTDSPSSSASVASERAAVTVARDGLEAAAAQERRDWTWRCRSR